MTDKEKIENLYNKVNSSPLFNFSPLKQSLFWLIHPSIKCIWLEKENCFDDEDYFCKIIISDISIYFDKLDIFIKDYNVAGTIVEKDYDSFKFKLENKENEFIYISEHLIKLDYEVPTLFNRTNIYTYEAIVTTLNDIHLDL